MNIPNNDNDLSIRRRPVSLIWVIIVFVSVIPFAGAATFIVNDAGNAGDANPGDGVAETATGVTTLWAAIEEPNALPGPDVIDFLITGVIMPAVELPALGDATGGTTINGGALDSTNDENGLVVISAKNVIENLTIGHFPRFGVRIHGFQASGNRV